MSNKVKLSDLDPAARKDLMAQLKKEEQREKAAQAKKRKTYEKNREKRIQKAIRGVNRIEKLMTFFKEEVSEMMASQHDELNEFGMIPTKSKGGFSITSNDGQFKITRTRDTDPKWDETAHKGVALVQEFLVEEGTASANPGIFNLFMGLIAKNEAGELEYSKVMTFIKYESEFDDPKWKEGLRLIKEGYSIEFKKYGYQFFQKDSEGKWKSISINFSNL